MTGCAFEAGSDKSLGDEPRNEMTECASAHSLPTGMKMSHLRK